MKMFNLGFAATIFCVSTVSMAASPLADLRKEFRRHLPTKPKAAATCASFAGDWEGTCFIGGLSYADRMKIDQDGCETIYMGDDWVINIGGIASATTSYSTGSDSMSQLASWEADNTEVLLRHNMLGNSLSGTKYVQLNGTFVIKYNEGSLETLNAYSIDTNSEPAPLRKGSGKTSCSYNKANKK